VKRFLHVLSWAVCVLWIGVAGLSMVYVIVAGRSPNGPELFGHRFMVVLSDSMIPTIRHGDLVVGKPPLPGAAQVGDIVSYRDYAEQKLITHRVVAVTEGAGERSYITKGDANGAPDTTPVYERDLVAAYAFRIPYAGFLLAFAKSFIGLVVLVIIPSLVLMGSEIVQMVRLLKRGERAQPENLTQKG
jgi:signal peptidase